MNKFTKIFLILITIIFALGLIMYFSPSGTKECPDEKIINEMPVLSGTSSLPSNYYIKNGQRKEISDYNKLWVKLNCKVVVNKVY